MNTKLQTINGMLTFFSQIPGMNYWIGSKDKSLEFIPVHRSILSFSACHIFFFYFNIYKYGYFIINKVII